MRSSQGTASESVMKCCYIQIAPISDDTNSAYVIADTRGSALAWSLSRHLHSCRVTTSNKILKSRVLFVSH
jgi:hypothetical protein